MTENIGLTNLKATPLEVLLTPRLDTSFTRTRFYYATFL